VNWANAGIPSHIAAQKTDAHSRRFKFASTVRLVSVSYVSKLVRYFDTFLTIFSERGAILYPHVHHCFVVLMAPISPSRIVVSMERSPGKLFARSEVRWLR
jgi:hypothetical protein